MTPAVRRRWLAASLALGALGIVIRIWLFQQPVNSDDVHYFAEASSATSLSELGDTSNSNGLRLAVMALPAIYSNLFDSPRVAFYGAIYSHALLTLAGVLAFAWVLSGPRAAAIAVALWATSYVAIGVDTRLVPDNLGTGFALLGLAAVAHAGLRRDDQAAPSTRALAIFAGVGGLLLWLSFCARESFFVFPGVGLGFALLARRRWVVTAAVLGGLLVGFVLEYACMSAAFDDGLLRWKAAFAYRESIADAGAAEVEAAAAGEADAPPKWSGYDVVDLFVRYPRLLAASSWVDLVIHVLGLIGVVVWAIGWRDRRRLAKLGAVMAAYGFLAFAIVSVSPLVPLLREKLRYYVTAAPFLGLAAAELIELALFAQVRHPRLARWLDHRARMIGVAVVAGVLVLAGLRVSSRGREFARNGNDAHWNAAARMVDDAATHRRPHTLISDVRTGRVSSILLPRDWDTLTRDRWPEAPPASGYVLLDWRRLDTNARKGKLLPAWTYRVLEHAPLVLRQRRGNDLVDVFFHGDVPLDRHPVELDEPYPAGWSGYCAATKDTRPVAEAPACSKDLFRFTGGDAVWRPRDGHPLDGDRFVEVVVEARSARPAVLRATLNRWRPDSAKPVTQPMGMIAVGTALQTYAMWTYVRDPAASYRIVLRGPSGIEITSVRTYTLDRDPSDDVRGIGAPW